MPKNGATNRLHDYRAYQHATHADLIKLTRQLIAMPFGELTKIHKEQARALGATSPGVVFTRAVMFCRLANGQIKNGKPGAE
jgi:hypothetical protein